MKAEITPFKLLMGFFIVLALLAVPASATDQGYAFNPGDKQISFYDKIFSNPLTATGAGRSCSDYPDATGFGPAGGSLSFQGCGGYQDEYNFYTVDSQGGWHFITERAASTSFSSPYNWAWECYKCPAPQAQCIEGDTQCISDSQTQICSNGQWVNQNTCSTSESCNPTIGQCVSTQCTERWTCGQWSECLGGTQYRECTDTNACGTNHFKPKTTQSCTVTTTTIPAPGPGPTPPNGSGNTGLSGTQYAVIGGIVLIVGAALLYIWRKRR